MANVADLTTQLESTLRSSAESLIAALPGIATALLLLLLGWVAARLIRSAALKLLGLLNLFLGRVLSGRARDAMYFSAGITRLIAGILFWITLFVFVVEALNTAGLTGVADWLQRLVEFLSLIHISEPTRPY